MLCVPIVLAACGSPSLSPISGLGGGKPVPAVASDRVVTPPVETLDPTPPPPPPPRARTAQQFDTTSAEDRAAALDVKPPTPQERKLGVTVASLGSPADPGIWVKTPLVKSLVMGRVEVVATGKSANIELRPGTGGTQISLPAMRLLNVPLTDLPEIAIYAK